LVAVWFLAGMSSSAGSITPANNGVCGTMVEPPDAVVEYVEKDSTGRYVRVFD